MKFFCCCCLTAIPYRVRTGPEQGFPCVLILTGKTLFSLQGTPVLIAGILYSLQGMGLQCSSGKILIRERFSSWDKYFVVLIIFCPFQISTKCALIRAFLISRALVLSLIHLQTYCLFINLLHIKLHSRLISNQTKTLIHLLVYIQL